MKVQIEIECETAGDLTNHLFAIIETVKIRSRNNQNWEFEVGTRFTANTRCGTHEVTIEPEPLNNEWYEMD